MGGHRGVDQVPAAGGGTPPLAPLLHRLSQQRALNRLVQLAPPLPPSVGIVQWVLCSGCCAVGVVQWVLCSGCCVVGVVQWVLCSGCCAVGVVQWVLCSWCCAVGIVQWVLCSGCCAVGSGREVRGPATLSYTGRT
ncbi:hypothetical protein ACOMHN_002519 [Nucella lapillus]